MVNFIKPKYYEFLMILSHFFQIESVLKSCPLVDNICVCGGSYSNHVTALVSPNQKNLLRMTQQMGLTSHTITDVCNNKEVNKRVYLSIVETATTAGISKKEIPVKIRLVCDEWTPDNDMLTAAMKMKRKNVENRYRDEIQWLFTDSDDLTNNNNFNNNIKK